MSEIYGRHSVPFAYEDNEIDLNLESSGDGIKYLRRSKDNSSEKKLFTNNNNFHIHPIEPLNLPKEISSALLIEFDEPIIIDSSIKNKIYTTFPIEIGIFNEGKTNKLLDVFTMNKNKFTLYGDVKTGTICKYWSTETYEEIPDNVDTLKEGILEITINNTTNEWKEVNKVVLSAYDMKIYYNEEKISMKGKLTIKDDDKSETSVINNPLFEEMSKSKEVYRKKKSPIKNKAMKFIMDSGI